MLIFLQSVNALYRRLLFLVKADKVDPSLGYIVPRHPHVPYGTVRVQLALQRYIVLGVCEFRSQSCAAYVTVPGTLLYWSFTAGLGTRAMF